jgi:hypothetical protein
MLRNEVLHFFETRRSECFILRVENRAWAFEKVIHTFSNEILLGFQSFHANPSCV